MADGGARPTGLWRRALGGGAIGGAGPIGLQPRRWRPSPEPIPKPVSVSVSVSV
jgi:hypothetical protein